MKNLKKILLSSVLVVCSGCADIHHDESLGTNSPLDACKMLTQNRDWMVATHNAYIKWGIPVSVQLSVIKHESSFNRDASATTSSAYGYAQALNNTWSDYKKDTGNKTASRGSFFDSTDFIGWYWSKVNSAVKLSPYDAGDFYLAYHEGIGGFQKRSFLKKRWLMRKTRKIQSVANRYRFQINKCRIKI